MMASAAVPKLRQNYCGNCLPDARASVIKKLKFRKDLSRQATEKA
jgi:hypothetical protein